jgi:hypothetical protein
MYQYYYICEADNTPTYAIVQISYECSIFFILATIIILTMWPEHGVPIMLPFFFLRAKTNYRQLGEFHTYPKRILIYSWKMFLTIGGISSISSL